jgi:hypothetical protein
VLRAVRVQGRNRTTFGVAGDCDSNDFYQRIALQCYDGVGVRLRFENGLSRNRHSSCESVSLRTWKMLGHDIRLF